MPKELTHWWIAAEAAGQLEPDSPTAILLKQEQALYLTGAVLPDTLLHLVYGKWSSVALRLAERFHNPEENSFAPLTRYLASFKGMPVPDSHLACLLGIAAHIEADIVFHPYICSLSANSISLHYQYETELDLYLLSKAKHPPVMQLKNILTPEISDTVAMVTQAVFDSSRELPPEIIKLSIWLHCFIQGIYGSFLWQLLADCLAVLPINFLRTRHKLFYPLLWKNGRNRIWPDKWKDPATDETRHETPETLEEISINRIVKLFETVDKKGIFEAFSKHRGENLITGK